MYNDKPILVFWELTQACDLACQHCRASAKPFCDPAELNLEEGKRLIDEISDWKGPILILTGGDPLKQPHFWDWLDYAQKKRLPVCVTPSPTSLVTPIAIYKMKELGVKRLALSLDGASPNTHDTFRGVSGSFERVIKIISAARSIKMPIQINTTLTHHNLSELKELAGRVIYLGAVLWSLFFLVPMGRGKNLRLFDAEEIENLFGEIYQLGKIIGIPIKTTEAPHYRRYVLQKKGMAGLRAPGTGDGRGVVFVSHTGEIYPSGFLPLSIGNVKKDSLRDGYCHSELFQLLRDPDQFKGKCGICEFRHLCGGARAQAYAATGDPLESDPCCGYISQKHPAAV